MPFAAPECAQCTSSGRKLCRFRPWLMDALDIRIGCMCGIVGLFSKSSAVEERLREHLAAMLVQLGDRGPDSAGVAVYREPAPPRAAKGSRYSPEPAVGLHGVAVAPRPAFGGEPG